MSKVKDVVCDFNNLYTSLQKCCNGVKWKDSVARAYNNALAFTYALWQSLHDGTYEIDPYNEFTIYEPKTRIVTSTRFKDRVVEKSFCDNYYIKQITKSFIYDNGACQKGKGTDFSRNRLKVMLRRYYKQYGNKGYVLQLDIRSFFGSTRHDVLKSTLSKYIDDEWAQSFLFSIIDSYANNEDEIPTGIGLGSETNQYSQLALLSDVDHFVKEKQQVSYYNRYMDDIILIHHSKKHLQKTMKKIEVILEKKGLQLNKEKSHIYQIKQGIPYLGFVFFLTDTGKVITRLNKDNIKKGKRKTRAFERLLIQGKIDIEAVNQSLQSRFAHIDKCNGYQVKKRMIQYSRKHLRRFYGIRKSHNRGTA